MGSARRQPKWRCVSLLSARVTSNCSRASEAIVVADHDLENRAANGDEAATKTLAASREGFSGIVSAWDNAVSLGKYAAQFRFGLL